MCRQQKVGIFQSSRKQNMRLISKHVRGRLDVDSFGYGLDFSFVLLLGSDVWGVGCLFANILAHGCIIVIINQNG